MSTEFIKCAIYQISPFLCLLVSFLSFFSLVQYLFLHFLSPSSKHIDPAVIQCKFQLWLQFLWKSWASTLFFSLSYTQTHRPKSRTMFGWSNSAMSAASLWKSFCMSTDASSFSIFTATIVKDSTGSRPGALQTSYITLQCMKVFHGNTKNAFLLLYCPLSLRKARTRFLLRAVTLQIRSQRESVLSAIWIKSTWNTHGCKTIHTSCVGSHWGKLKSLSVDL